MNLARDDRDEANRILDVFPQKYPENIAVPILMPTPEEVRIFRVTPTVISVLDYAKGFGHTDLVTCQEIFREMLDRPAAERGWTGE